MYELIAKLVYDEMNNYRCIKKEYIGTNSKIFHLFLHAPIKIGTFQWVHTRTGEKFITQWLNRLLHLQTPYASVASQKDSCLFCNMFNTGSSILSDRPTFFTVFYDVNQQTKTSFHHYKKVPLSFKKLFHHNKICCVCNPVKFPWF